MSDNCFQPCPPPCPPKCNCTSDDVPYVGPAIMCTGILTNQSLTEVINQLSISIKSRLFQIQSDSLVVTPLPSTATSIQILKLFLLKTMVIYLLLGQMDTHTYQVRGLVTL